MKTLSKYKKFLIDKRLYLENQNFWKATFSANSDKSFEDWSITKYANGEDFFDGNPIASALYPGLNRAVRIIQISTDEHVPSLRAWIEDVVYNEKSIKELVIIVQPTDQAYKSVLIMLSLFINETTLKTLHKYIRASNTFYKSKVNFDKIALTAHQLNPFDLSDVKNSIRKAISKKISTHGPSSKNRLHTR